HTISTNTRCPTKQSTPHRTGLMIGARRARRLPRSMAPQLTALIMAAGHGTRMHSSLPKVLHPVCGVPMLHWVIEAAQVAGADRVVCITRGRDVAAALPTGVEAAEQ